MRLMGMGCSINKRVSGAIGTMVFTAMVFGFSVTPRGVEVVPQAYAQQDASAALDAISSDLSRLESGSLDAELVRTKFSAEERLSDARVAYELGQYDRSSYLFLDVISRTSAIDRPL